MIRQAKKEDAQAISQLLYVIFKDMELPILESLGKQKVCELVAVAIVDPSYRFGYARGLVYELDGKVAGVAFGYPAEAEKIIDVPLEKVMQQAGIADDIRLFVDPEAYPDEWYLDSIVTDDDYRGKGIGTQLLAALPEIARKAGKNKIGLNVDLGNPQAKKLYERVGYRKVGELMISGHQYEHLQKEI